MTKIAHQFVLSISLQKCCSYPEQDFLKLFVISQNGVAQQTQNIKKADKKLGRLEVYMTFHTFLPNFCQLFKYTIGIFNHTGTPDIKTGRGRIAVNEDLLF
jgi:hypothetical protein